MLERRLYERMIIRTCIITSFCVYRGVSHSVLSDMRTIEQENVHTTPSSLSSLGKLRISDSDNFFDDYSFGSGFSMNRNSNSAFSSSKTFDSLLSESNSSKNARYTKNV